MSDNNRLIVAILCGVTVIAYHIVNNLIKGNNRGKKFIERAKRNGCITTGKEIHHTYRGGTLGGDATDARTSEVVIYSYYVEGKEYRKKIEYSSMSKNVDYPTNVTIYYDKNKHSVAYTAGELNTPNQVQKGCYISLVLSILIIIAVYNLLKLI